MMVVVYVDDFVDFVLGFKETGETLADRQVDVPRDRLSTCSCNIRNSDCTKCNALSLYTTCGFSKSDGEQRGSIAAHDELFLLSLILSPLYTGKK